jgi:hypothetical protein
MSGVSKALIVEAIDKILQEAGGPYDLRDPKLIKLLADVEHGKFDLTEPE